MIKNERIEKFISQLFSNYSLNSTNGIDYLIVNSASCDFSTIYFQNDRFVDFAISRHFYVNNQNFDSENSPLQITLLLKNILDTSRDGFFPYLVDQIPESLPENFNQLKLRDMTLKPISTKMFSNNSLAIESKIETLLVQIYESNLSNGLNAQVKLSLKNLIHAMVVSNAEFQFVLDCLQQKNFLSFSASIPRAGFEKCYIRRTIEGINYYQQISNTKKKMSKNVFIAMKFNWSNEENEELRSNFVDTIKSACDQSGNFQANIVSNAHTGYITDQIIKEILESAFVIADFTYNNHGVYYEAGYARALNKNVIHLVHEKHVKDLHFDIKQINYISWDNLETLKHNLINRIGSLNI